jgi:predicted nucleic acid-binding protein
MDRRKSAAARRILADEDVAVSAQVIQEFYWAATRPYKLALTHEQALTYVEAWKSLPFQETNLQIIDDALFLTGQFRIAYWDAAIIAAARHMDCDTLYTEDLNHGQDYEGVIAVNPFINR